MPEGFHFKHRLHFPLPHTRIAEEPTLYISHTIRRLGVSLVGLFLPVYILTLPNKFLFNSNPITNSVIWILLFFMFRSMTTIVILLPSIRLIFLKINFKGSFLLSTIFTSAYLILLLAAKNNPFLIFAASIASGLIIVFYWIPFHIFFVRKTHSNQGKYGTKVSYRVTLSKTSQAIGPLAGGLLINAYGFDIAFIISLILIFIAAIPIITGLKEHKHSDHSLKQIITKFLFNKNFRNISISLGVFSLEDILFTALWPLLIFTVLGSIIKLGAISSLSMALSIITAIYIGRFIDKHGSAKIHRIGIFLNSFLHLTRVISRTPIAIYTIDVIDRLNGALYAIPFISKEYELAKGKHDSNFIIYRELVIHSSIMMVLMLCILIISFLPRWELIFLLPFIFSSLTYLMTVKRRKKSLA